MNESMRRATAERSWKYAGKTLVALRDTNPHNSGSQRHRAYQIILDAPNRSIPFEDYYVAGGTRKILCDSVRNSRRYRPYIEIK